MGRVGVFGAWWCVPCSNTGTDKAAIQDAIMPLTLDKLRQAARLLHQAAWRIVVPLHDTQYLHGSPSPTSRPSDVRDAAWQSLARGEPWGERWQTVWLRQPLRIP